MHISCRKYYMVYENFHKLRAILRSSQSTHPDNILLLTVSRIVLFRLQCRFEVPNLSAFDNGANAF